MAQPETSSANEVSRLGPIPSLKRTISGGLLGISSSSPTTSQSMVVSSLSSNVAPPMLRSVTSGGTYSKNVSAVGSRPPQLQNQPNDWRTFLTIEERQAVRTKIHSAYTNNCQTYEDLLETIVAIEEELLHISAPSRLDYFKSGFEFENRVKLKRNQLDGRLAAFDTRDPPRQVGIKAGEDNTLPNKKSRK